MHKVPDLAYDFNAVEPHIDAKTMEIHHDKHHAAYVTNLNKALEGHDDLAALSVDDLLRKIDDVPESIRGAVRNHGGGHANHTLFWDTIGPDAGAASDELEASVEAAFGSKDALKEQLCAAAMGQFGSGWGWLVKSGDSLEILARPNQDSPLMEGKTPILGVDVWEHAYYLRYQNRRADYLAAWWEAINWSAVSARFSG